MCVWSQQGGAAGGGVAATYNLRREANANTGGGARYPSPQRPRFPSRGHHPGSNGTPARARPPPGSPRNRSPLVVVVRIIDLSCSTAHPRQWLKLLHDFHGRQGGPLEVRLTVVHDDNDYLANMRTLLSNKADKLKIPFQFSSVIGRLETLDFSNLRNTLYVKYGEAIAISCSLRMHRLLMVDEKVSCSGIGQLQKMANIAQLKKMASSVYSPASTLNYPQTPSPQCQTLILLDSFLNAVRVLKPNIMLVMEQDANHNALLFCDRFVEAFNYYAALFDCLHALVAANPRRADERARVERMILGEEIKNILVCEESIGTSDMKG